MIHATMNAWHERKISLVYYHLPNLCKSQTGGLCAARAMSKRCGINLTARTTNLNVRAATAGYLRAKQLALPILAFLLDERAPWSPALMDGHGPQGLQSDASRI